MVVRPQTLPPDPACCVRTRWIDPSKASTRPRHPTPRRSTISRVHQSMTQPPQTTPRTHLVDPQPVLLVHQVLDQVLRPAPLVAGLFNDRLLLPRRRDDATHLLRPMSRRREKRLVAGWLAGWLGLRCRSPMAGAVVASESSNAPAKGHASAAQVLLRGSAPTHQPKHARLRTLPPQTAAAGACVVWNGCGCVRG